MCKPSSISNSKMLLLLNFRIYRFATYAKKSNSLTCVITVLMDNYYMRLISYCLENVLAYIWV